MRVAVIGAGAVGLGIASGLSARGVEVLYLVNRAAQRTALERDGITRTGIFGDLHVAANCFEVSDQLEALARSPADYWLVCTKSTHSRALASALAPIWQSLRRAQPPGTAPLIVLCQNGWGNDEIFGEWIPTETIFNARVITGFERENSTTVRVTVHADSIRIGSLHGMDPAVQAPLCAAIARGGIPCEVSHEIARDLWAKVLYNDLLNPLGALVGVAYGVLGERPQTRAVMEALAHETFSVMRAAGFESHWASADEYLTTFYAELLPATADHQSSMLQDLRAGRPTEIDQLCGAITGLADEHGVPAPLNRALLALIHGVERHEEPARQETTARESEP